MYHFSINYFKASACENFLSLAICRFETAKKIYVLLSSFARKPAIVSEHKLSCLAVDFDSLETRQKMALEVAKVKAISYSEEPNGKEVVPLVKVTNFNFGFYNLSLDDKALLVDLLFNGHLAAKDFVVFQTRFCLALAVFDSCTLARPKVAKELQGSLPVLLRLADFCIAKNIKSGTKLSKNALYKTEFEAVAKSVASKATVNLSQNQVVVNEKFDNNSYFLVKANYLDSFAAWIEKLQMKTPVLVHADVPYNLTTAAWDQETFGKTSFAKLIEQLKVCFSLTNEIYFFHQVRFHCPMKSLLF